MRFTNLLLTIACVSLFNSCGNAAAGSPPVETQNVNTIAQGTVKVDTILYATVDGLTLRDVPDVEGKALGSIPYGASVVDLGEVSEFKEKITLRGKVHYTTWRRIAYRFPNGNTITGWAYGGGLDATAPPAENRFASPEREAYDLHQASGQQVTEIIDVDVPLEYAYDGKIGYIYENENGRPILDGDFKVSTTWDIEISRNYTHTASITATGHYAKGRKNGAFKIAFDGYENASTFTAFYNDGGCKWFEVSFQSEGPPVTMREDNPASCTLNYMGSWMKRNYN